ncbi:outer membrane beta-barrel protein [Daejeonella sp.]|jgi:hypothetical protein|uniref:outer membrane beta-barrel protein n=1 Tax=Daejeonella sp. TaxID=2805397 RepID=UPI003783EA44
MTQISKTLSLIFTFFIYVLNSYAQDQEVISEPLSVSGSVDTYYKYDFSGRPNFQTSFVNEQNSVSLGMINLTMKKNTGKTSFVGDLSFGPRGQSQSLLNSSASYNETTANSFNIQNLYVAYAFTDKFSMTAGFMGTFIGYEVISPVANFNYSTSYLFSSGPFQNSGIKANYSFSKNVGLMVGLFNDWNKYQDFNGVSDFGAQLYISPREGWNTYLNVITGFPSGTEFDLTSSYQVNNSVKLALNAADYSVPNNGGGFSGAALYAQYAFDPNASLGIRGEYFKSKANSVFLNIQDKSSVSAITISGNIRSGGLTFIPEVRFDSGSQQIFQRQNGLVARQASQFSLAAVFAF